MDTISRFCFIASLVAGSLSAGEVVGLEVRGPYLIAKNIYVNAQGPFRFLLDTGAQSCAITPELAARLHVAVTGRVERVSIAGSTVAGLGTLQQVVLGPAALEKVEVSISSLPALRQLDRNVDGILGQSFLAHFNYILDYKGHRFLPEPGSVQGEAVAFERTDGLMIVNGMTAGGTRKLVIDSGAPGLVLFGEPSPDGGRSATVTTNSGTIRAVVKRERVQIGGWRSKLMDARVLPGDRPGLLPTAAFDALYVNNREGYVIFGQ